MISTIQNNKMPQQESTWECLDKLLFAAAPPGAVVWARGSALCSSVAGLGEKHGQPSLELIFINEE